MILFSKLHKHGDTMVEVMLSMAVIGMVIGGAYTISNKATQLGRLAQQRTQANNLMRGQAELIKLFRDGNTLQWSNIADGATDTAPATQTSCSTKISNYAPTSQSFYIKSSDQSVVQYSSDNNPSTVTTESADVTGRYQIFVVPYAGVGYIDFYIIGCWQGPGSYGVQQSFIIERLNNPS